RDEFCPRHAMHPAAGAKFWLSQVRWVSELHLPTPSALTHTQPQNRKRRSRSLPVRRRGERNYGNAVLATTGGQERAGCLRMENGKKTAAASNKQTVLQAADTPPVPVRM